MKRNKLLSLLLTILLVFSLSSCKHIFVTTIGTLEDIIVDLEDFESKLNELTVEEEDDDEIISSALEYEYTIDGLIYRRDDLVNHLGSYTEPSNERFYLDELDIAKDFIAKVKEVVIENKESKAGENLSVENVTYNINVTLDGSVLIHYTYGDTNEIYKLRITGSKLRIESLKYQYNEVTFDPLLEEGLRFEYYNFYENDSIVKISIDEQHEMLTYASLKNGTYYLVDHKEETVNEDTHSIYSVDYYNSERQSLNQYWIKDGEIISESINVYDTHSIAYQYIDYDVSDDLAYLRVNFLQAEGYDYIMTTAYNGPTNPNEGIYDVEGNSLYNGDIMFHYNMDTDTTRTFLTIDITSETSYDLLFDLSGYGLELDSDYANVNSFDENRLNDVKEISEELKIGQLDFFYDNIDISAYQYIDVDMKSIINKFYNPTIPVKVNDELLYSSDMINFYSNFNILKQLIITEDSTIDDNRMLSSTHLDLNNKYYRIESFDVLNISKSYLMSEVDNKLFAFVNDYDLRNRHYLINEESTEESFMEQLEDKININLPLENITSVDKLSEGKYQINGDVNILGFMSYRLLEDKEYQKYLISEVSAIITFNEEHTSYTMDFTVTGMTNPMDDFNEVIYEGSRTYTLDSFNLYNPLEDEDYTLSLSWKKEDIIKSSSVGDIYNFDILEDSERWIKLDLTQGAYTMIEAEYDERLIYTVYDAEDNIISNQKEFYVEEDGIYYMRLVSPTTQTVTISFIESDFDKFASEVLDFTTTVGIFNTVRRNDRYYVITPSDERRIMKLTIDEENCNCVFEDMFTLQLVPDDLYEEPQMRYISGTVSSYYYLEPGVNYYIKATANTNQIHLFNYELITLPDSDNVVTDIYVDSIYDYPDVYLTPLQNEVNVHFTVSVRPLNTLMSLNTYFRASNFEIKLFKENGEELDFVSYLELPPGNYYFKYKIDSDDSIMFITTSFDDLN